MNKQTESISADEKLKRCMGWSSKEKESLGREGKLEVMESQGTPLLDRWLSVLVLLCSKPRRL